MLEMKFLTSGFRNFSLALELCAYGCKNECYWDLFLTWICWFYLYKIEYLFMCLEDIVTFIITGDECWEKEGYSAWDHVPSYVGNRDHEGNEG